MITVTGEFVLGMIIALVVNSAFRGRGLMRAAMLVPWAIPTVISAQMWKWMYHDVYGVVNDFLVATLGLLPENVAWVADPRPPCWLSPRWTSGRRRPSWPCSCWPGCR